MTAIKREWNRFLGNSTRDERMILLIVISIFMPVYVTMASIIYVIVDLAVHHRLKTVVTETAGLFYLIAFSVVSFFISALYSNWQGILIAAGMCAIFIIAAYMRMIMTRSFFEKLIDLCCDMSLFAFLIALVQTYIYGASVSDYRAASTFINPNYYATMIEIVVLFCSYKLLRGKHSRSRNYYLFVIAVNLAGLSISDCRTALLVLLVAMPVMLAFYRKFRLLKWFGIFVAVGVVLFCFVPQIFPRFEDMADDLTARFSIWQTAVTGIRNYPLFGQGGMTYSHIYAMLGGHAAPHAHSLFLDPLLNFGVVGMGLLAPYFFQNIKKTVQMYTEGRDKSRAFLTFTIVFAVLLHGLTDITVFWPQTGMLIAVVLGSVGIYEKQTAAVREFGMARAPVPAVRVSSKGSRAEVSGFSGCVSLQKRIVSVELVMPAATLVVQKPELWLILASLPYFNGKLAMKKRQTINSKQKLVVFNRKIRQELHQKGGAIAR